ncbi:hypothetical protein GGR50DRAFT_638142 [Xylaria sp. CBS 124048]|nr:hypothetical protein GGR50DRAFT_638142 [Xylaria sp. CBS 124048]
MLSTTHFHALSFWATLTVSPVAVLAQSGTSGTVSATPHDSYSSSVGVLGCKVDTDRIAYWPGSVDCNNICVTLSYQGRSVNLLRVDSSQGAHDVSYDAWNYLVTGFPATQKPSAGGGIDMDFQYQNPSKCADLIHTDGHKLPLSAPNSMDFLASCLEQSGSWVSQNYVLYNILDAVCSFGVDEKCTLDWPTANQPACPHMLGNPVALTTDPVFNILYPSGDKVLASTGQVISTGGTPGGDVGGGSGEDSGTMNLIPGLFGMPAIAAMLSLAFFHLFMFSWPS